MILKILEILIDKIVCISERSMIKALKLSNSRRMIFYLQDMVQLEEVAYY